MTRPFGPEPEDFADVHEAAEAAASVRFQPAEDTSVCPACFHAPHWGGMCLLCLCFKVHAIDSIEAAADQPNSMIDDLGQVFYPDNDEDAAAFAEAHGARYMHPQRVCPYGDPTCPCQDGDTCHYEGPDPMSPPSEDPQVVDEPVDEPELPRGRHRREVPKSSKLARLRKAFRRG